MSASFRCVDSKIVNCPLSVALDGTTTKGSWQDQSQRVAAVCLDAVHAALAALAGLAAPPQIANVAKAANDGARMRTN
jgi:hypothetical protein